MGTAMGMPEYRQVIETFCRNAAIENITDVLHHGAITVQGIPVWLQYFEPADLCRILMDLGAPDQGIPSDVWRMMLESNCTNGSVSLPFLGINPINGHAILILHLSVSMLLQEADFPKLLDEQLIPVARVWRELFNVVDVAGDRQYPLGLDTNLA